MSIVARLAVAISICGFVATLDQLGNCTDTSWEKVGGVKPESVHSQTVLFSAVNSDGITKPCFERCEHVNCTGFVVDFGRSVCYSVRTEGDDELVPEPNSTFYHRICVKVPVSCKRGRLWQVERSPGAIFIDSGAFHLPRSITRNQCYEHCIETGRSCESSQFRTTKPLAASDAFGRCSLSLLERGTRPHAYRASMYRDEYLRDQCRNVSKREYCSYAEFQNVSLPYSDVALPKLDQHQCERRCDSSADGFVCRGYTLDNSSGEPVCLLHSEDTSSLGVSSLIVAPNSVYREREPCLDLKVRCDASTFTIELRTTDAFFGRMYANGYAETCGVQGVGGKRTALTIPLPSADNLRDEHLECGLHPAFSVDHRNRTRPMVWTTIVVQFNPIVQRLGDQAVRVGCSLNDLEPPEPRNLTVHSSFSFLDPNAGVPPISSTIVNASSEVPTVTMRILDENSRDAVVTHLGQRLVLKIQVNPTNGPYNIAAGHLVASSASGDASYLLLDEVGCPTDPTTFPTLTKDPTDGRSLISTFTAFKFPNSQLVRFNVIVRFCLEECAPTKCKGNRLSYGKRKRATEVSGARPSDADADADADAKVKDVVGPDESLEELLPLQLSIIVQSTAADAAAAAATAPDAAVVSSADRLSSRENGSPDTVFIAGPNSVDGLFCVDASLALSLLIFWLIVQIVLIVGCLLVVAQYRRTAIRAEEDRATVLAGHLYGIHGGNFEIARRVRWADHNASSSTLG